LEIDYVNGDLVPAQDLFNLYVAWAKKNNEFEMTSRKFFTEIGKKLPEKVRKSSGMFYPSVKQTDYAQELMRSGTSKQYSINDFS
jgi:phage/plasmid-associated DNA primase